MLHFGQRPYHPLNQVQISASALSNNYRLLKNATQLPIAPVLKSNAYGHGLKQVAPVFDALQAPYLIVDSLFEAYQLYKLRVQTPILILGYTDPRNYQTKRLPFEYAVFDLETAQALAKYQPHCLVHIFVDTGMHREGISLQDLPSFLQQLRSTNLKVNGLTSHLADADNPSSNINSRKQLAQFEAAYTILLEHDVHPTWRHLAASAGALQMKSPLLNLVRAGIASYGISPFPTDHALTKKLNLQPALKVTTHIAQIKTVPKNAAIGYNGTFTTTKKTRLAILPIGYYDGLDRRLSNSGCVLVHGQACPILGRVSMNITTIDITKVPDCSVGDEVVVYSDQPSDPNSITASAQRANTIAYELLVGLTETMHRQCV